MLLLVDMLNSKITIFKKNILLKSPTVDDVGGLFIKNKKELKQKRKKSNIIAIIDSL